MKSVHPFFQRLLEFVFPRGCLTCDMALEEGDVWICRNCWATMDKVHGAVTDGVIEFDHIDEIRSGLYYDRKLQTLIHYFKYQRALSLAETFAAILSDVVHTSENLKKADLLIPVPLHKVKLRERSYNQSEEIAKALSARISIPCRCDILLRGVNTASQTKMEDAKERVHNMRDVFYVKKSDQLTGKKVILIDDLITTGSTANACAGVLKQSGCEKVFVLTVGRPYF